MSNTVGVYAKLGTDSVHVTYDSIEQIEHLMRTNGWNVDVVTQEDRENGANFFIETLGEKDYVESAYGTCNIDGKYIEISVDLTNLQIITNPYIRGNLCVLKNVEMLSIHDVSELGLPEQARTFIKPRSG